MNAEAGVPVGDTTLLQRLKEADDLLRRISEWDMLYVSRETGPVTADAPYWQAEIARCRAALAPFVGEATQSDG